MIFIVKVISSFNFIQIQISAKTTFSKSTIQCYSCFHLLQIYIALELQAIVNNILFFKLYKKLVKYITNFTIT